MHYNISMPGGDGSAWLQLSLPGTFAVRSVTVRQQEERVSPHFRIEYLGPGSEYLEAVTYTGEVVAAQQHVFPWAVVTSAIRLSVTGPPHDDEWFRLAGIEVTGRPVAFTQAATGV